MENSGNGQSKEGDWPFPWTLDLMNSSQEKKAANLKAMLGKPDRLAETVIQKPVEKPLEKPIEKLVERASDRHIGKVNEVVPIAQLAS